MNDYNVFAVIMLLFSSNLRSSENWILKGAKDVRWNVSTREDVSNVFVSPIYEELFDMKLNYTIL